MAHSIHELQQSNQFQNVNHFFVTAQLSIIQLELKNKHDTD